MVRQTFLFVFEHTYVCLCLFVCECACVCVCVRACVHVVYGVGVCFAELCQTVLRNFLSFLRTTWVSAFIPLDKNIQFHKGIAWVSEALAVFFCLQLCASFAENKKTKNKNKNKTRTRR